jgi:hypothetical protein
VLSPRTNVWVEELIDVRSLRRTKAAGQDGAVALLMRRLHLTKQSPETGRLKTRLGLAVLIGTIATLAMGFGAGGAYAYWTSTGSGSGSGSAGTLQAVTVAAFVGGDTPAATIFPGGSADVILRVSNPNAFAVTLISVSGNGTIAPDAGHAGCTTTGVTFTNQTGLSSAIGASGTTLVDLPAAAAMGITSSNGCQGATFSIPVSITVHKG